MSVNKKALIFSTCAIAMLSFGCAGKNAGQQTAEEFKQQTYAQAGEAFAIRSLDNPGQVVKVETGRYVESVVVKSVAQAPIPEKTKTTKTPTGTKTVKNPKFKAGQENCGEKEFIEVPVYAYSTETIPAQPQAPQVTTETTYGETAGGTLHAGYEKKGSNIFKNDNTVFYGKPLPEKDLGKKDPNATTVSTDEGIGKFAVKTVLGAAHAAGAVMSGAGDLMVGQAALNQKQPLPSNTLINGVSKAVVGDVKAEVGDVTAKIGDVTANGGTGNGGTVTTGDQVTNVEQNGGDQINVQKTNVEQQQYQTQKKDGHHNQCEYEWCDEDGDAATAIKKAQEHFRGTGINIQHEKDVASVVIRFEVTSKKPALHNTALDKRIANAERPVAFRRAAEKGYKAKYGA